jgi:hypothetical protein
VIVNAASEALAVPSLTLITMPWSVPTSPDPGVPLSWPVAELSVTHCGRLVAEKVSTALALLDAALT